MQTAKRTSVNTPLPWRGDELPARTQWRYQLTGSDVQELDALLEDDITGAVAPQPGEAGSPAQLPKLSLALAALAQELATGSGVARISGFPVERYGPKELRRLYLALASHFGTPTEQNRAEGLIREIRDRSASGGTRVDSAGQLNWHNDRTDVVGLLCVQPAAQGGVSRIVSATAIHNAMAERCPDLLHVLLQDFNRYSPGDEIGGTEGTYARPVFTRSKGTLSVHYSRTYIDQATSQPGNEPLSQAQIAALDTLVSLADELAFHMRLRAGDIQLLNNHAILHGRTPFEDGGACDMHRLLWRVWLASDAGEWSA